jgi:hypothetical protein
MYVSNPLEHTMQADIKPLADFLVNLGIDKVAHTQKNYLAHLVNVWRLMQRQGCDEELCRAGMFHSIYGTEKFQGFKIHLERRGELQELIGTRAERLAYWNCFMDRSSLDALLEQQEEPLVIRNRETGEAMALSRQEYNDLCQVHLYDWLEQAPRSSFGWNYRRHAYRLMAERSGPQAVAAYEQVYAQEPAAAAGA